MSIKQDIFQDDNQPAVNADWLNSVTNEVNNFIRPFVISLLNGDNTQFLEAILKAILGKLFCKLDPSSTGTQYNLVFNEPLLNILPEPMNYFDGMVLWINNTIQNTGLAKVNLLNKGSKDIFRQDGTPIQSGDLKIGLLALIYDESLNGFKKCNIV